MDNDAAFIRLAATVKDAGALALQKQGGVENVGKEEVGAANESERLKAMRRAKTIIDEQVQEMLLGTAAECWGDNVVIDAEEQTSSLSRFPKREGTRSLIIDPIDGTLEYLEGHDSYSVCIALIESGTLSFALVYFPARDIAYGVAPDGRSYEYPSFATKELSDARRAVLPPHAPRIVYKTRRVPEEFERRFTEAGFEVRGWDNYVQGLMAVFNGEAAGYLACEPQIRDVLIGPVIGTAQGGFMCGWRGEKITWPRSGRLAAGFFGNVALEKEFRAILS